MSPDRDDPLAQLPREAPPPPTLRKTVMRDLRRRGLIRGGRVVTVRSVLAAAAAIVLFVAGAWVGRGTAPAPAALAGEARFALFLYEGPGYDRSDPEETRVTEYAAWARSLGAALVMGEKLGDEERALGPSAEPAGATREILAGFFILDAGGWDEAMAIARDCPHLRYGGRVAVRELAT